MAKLDPNSLIDWERVYLPTEPVPDEAYSVELHFPGESITYSMTLWFHEGDPASIDSYTIGDIERWVTDDEFEGVPQQLLEQLLRRHALSLHEILATVLAQTHVHKS